MKLVKMLKSLVGKALQSETTEMRSIVIMQQKAHTFSEEELRAAGERAWGKKFDGIEDPMYFVSADHSVLTIVKAGPHGIRVTSIPTGMQTTTNMLFLNYHSRNRRRLGMNIMLAFFSICSMIFRANRGESLMQRPMLHSRN